jgi:hypothetical protein
MSDENGQEIGVNVYDDEDELIEDEEAAAPQPVEVVREEMVTITKNSDAEDNGSEDDLYEVVKSHSDQISRLADMVESLQSQRDRIIAGSIGTPLDELWLAKKIHHWWIRSTNKTDLTKSILFDYIQSFVCIGLACTKVKNPVSSISYLPACSYLLYCCSYRIKRYTILTSKRSTGSFITSTY